MSSVTCGWPSQGGENSGRKVISKQHRQRAAARSTRSSSSRRRRIDPVHVLEDHQHRLCARKRLELARAAPRSVCSFALLRRQVERRVAVPASGCDSSSASSGDVLGRGVGRRASSASSLSSLLVRRCRRVEAGRALELGDDRDRARCPGGAASRSSAGGCAARPQMPLQKRLQRGATCRCPARPTAARPGPRRSCLLPAPQQQLDLLLAADQRRERRRVQRLEAALDRARAQHAPGRAPARRSP